jgi:hypothetical protein
MTQTQYVFLHNTSSKNNQHVELMDPNTESVFVESFSLQTKKESLTRKSPHSIKYILSQINLLEIISGFKNFGLFVPI